MAPKTVEMMCKKLPQLWLVLQYLRNVETLKFKVNGMAVRLGSLGDGKEPDSLIKFT